MVRFCMHLLFPSWCHLWFKHIQLNREWLILSYSAVIDFITITHFNQKCYLHAHICNIFINAHKTSGSLKIRWSYWPNTFTLWSAVSNHVWDSCYINKNYCRTAYARSFYWLQNITKPMWNKNPKWYSSLKLAMKSLQASCSTPLYSPYNTSSTFKTQLIPPKTQEGIQWKSVTKD